VSSDRGKRKQPLSVAFANAAEVKASMAMNAANS
jgi:hypothetical protein